jgi:hypothetical protein
VGLELEVAISEVAVLPEGGEEEVGMEGMVTEESMWKDCSSGRFHSSSVLFVEVSIGFGSVDMKRYRLERRKLLSFSALLSLSAFLSITS